MAASFPRVTVLIFLRGNIFWNVFCEFHATIEFGLVFEVINWF